MLPASHAPPACYGGCVAMDAALEHATFAELVARVASRGADREAETEVCRRFAPRIRLYGLKHLRDEDAASELVQRVLVAVIEALRGGRIEEPQHFERFVLGTCRNLALRQRASERRAQPTDHEVLAQLEITMPRFEAVDASALFRCMAKLEVRAMTVLHLTYYRDKSAEEISEVLAISAANVRVVRHRAVVALRRCMEGAS